MASKVPLPDLKNESPQTVVNSGAPLCNPESQLLADLRVLDDLHRRLVGLRAVIPSILHPLRASYSTPVDMFTDFSTRAFMCSEEITQFTQMYVSAGGVFERAQQEIKKRPGIKIGRLKGEEIFLDSNETDVDARSGGVKIEEDAMALDVTDSSHSNQHQHKTQAALVTSDGDVRSIIQEWRNKHPEVAWATLDPDDKMKIIHKITLPDPSWLVFTLEIITTVTSGGPPRFSITAVRCSKSPGFHSMNMHTSILRNISARSCPENLNILLDMIGEYKAIFSTKCDVCGKLTTGGKVELPVIRCMASWADKKVILQDAASEKTWIALHESCA